MASATQSRNLAKWLDKRLSSDESLAFLLVRRFADKKKIGEVRVYVGDDQPIMSREQIITELREISEDDANGLKGYHRYQFEAFHGSAREASAVFTFGADGGLSEDDADENTFSEDTSIRGQTSMMMRLTNTVFSSSAGMQQRATVAYERMFELQSEELQRLREENSQLRRENSEIKIEERQAARDLRKQIWREEKMEQVIDQLIPVAGIAAGGIARKFLPGQAGEMAEGMIRKVMGQGGPGGQGADGKVGAPPPPPQSELELMIHGLVSSLKADQLGKLMGALEPGQQANMMMILKRFTEMKEAEEKRIADRLKAEGIDPMMVEKPELA